MKILMWISRILLGGVFVFSGFVKAIDPLGSAYKFQDYFLAFNIESLFPIALPLAVLLSTLEFVVGAGVLLGLKWRLSLLGGLFFMLFFTPLTLYIALTDPVPDCGCFGDAIIISNWETFYKNVVILLAALFLYFKRNRFKSYISEKTSTIFLSLITLGVVLLSIFCLRNLPIIDFRPWKVGNKISEQVLPQAEISDVYLIFEHVETGEIREYPANDYPWDDPEWVESWTFRDQRREVVQAYQEAPIASFYIENEFGDDLTDFFISEPGYVFIVAAYDLYSTRSRAFSKRITPLALEAEAAGHTFIVLTGSSYEAIETFRHQHQTPYPFYLSDEIELKTMIRSNPGLVLLKGGEIKGKWAHRNIPPFEELQKMMK